MKKIILYFIIAQLLGIYAGYILLTDVSAKAYIDQFSVAPFEQDSLLNVVALALVVLFGAVLILLLGKIRKTNLLIIAEAFSIIFGGSIIFYSFVKPFLQDFYESAITAGIISALLYSLKFLSKDDTKITINNILAIFASAGVGAIFGYSIGYIPMLLFVIFLAIYDYIAVFKTKHMITLAEMIDTKNLTLVLKSGKGTIKKGKKQGTGLALGTGDVVVPIALAVSFIRVSLLSSLLIELGAITALSYLLYKVKKERLFMPAIPYLTAGMIIGIISYFLIIKVIAL